MNPRTLLNLLLLVGLAGLILLAVYEPGLEQPADAPRLTGLDPAAVTRLELQHSNQSPIVLVKTGPNHWQMQQPYAAAADGYLAGNLRDLLQAEASSTYPADQIDLAAAGLTTPAATLTATITDSGETATLQIGGTDPVHGNRYVQVDDTVSLIPDYLTFNVTAEATALLSPSLLPPGAAITALELPALPAEQTADGNTLDATPARTLTRSDNGWTLNPAPYPAPSADTLNALGAALTSAWTQAQAAEIRPLETSAPLNAIGIVGIALGQEMLQFQVMTLKPQMVLARPDLGIAYHLPAAPSSPLLRPEIPSTTELGATSVAQ